MATYRGINNSLQIHFSWLLLIPTISYNQINMPLIDKNASGIVTFNDQILYAKGEDTFFKFCNTKSIQIDPKEYREAKFNNKVQTNEFIHHYTAKLSSNKFVTISYMDDNIVKLRNEDGKIIRALPNIKSPHNLNISSIETDINDNIWISAPTAHFIGHFDINGNELFKYECNKGLEPGIVNHPTHLFSKNNFLYVSDSGNRRIAKIDIMNYDISTYLKVPEPVNHFEQLQNREIYQLLSDYIIHR